MKQKYSLTISTELSKKEFEFLKLLWNSIHNENEFQKERVETQSKTDMQLWKKYKLNNCNSYKLLKYKDNKYKDNKLTFLLKLSKTMFVDVIEIESGSYMFSPSKIFYDVFPLIELE